MGYVVSLPGHRESVLEKEIPGLRMFVSPHIAGEGFRPSLNILVEDAKSQIEEYVEKQETEVLPALEGFELLAEEPVEMGRHWRLVYRLKEAKTGEHIVCCQDIIIEQGKVYVLRFTASKAQWERMKETFALSVSTFKVKRKQQAAGSR